MWQWALGCSLTVDQLAERIRLELASQAEEGDIGFHLALADQQHRERQAWLNEQTSPRQVTLSASQHAIPQYSSDDAMDALLDVVQTSLNPRASSVQSPNDSDEEEVETMEIPIPPKVMSFDYRVRIYRREVKGHIAQARQRVAELQALANAMHTV